MRNLKKAPHYTNQDLKAKVLDFITIGVGCNCLVSLSKSGLLTELLDNGFLSETNLAYSINENCMRGVLATLEKCEVLTKIEDKFLITQFGRILIDHLGLVSIFFDGYSNLVANQGKITQNKIKNKTRLLKGVSISQAAVQISEKLVESVVTQEVEKINLKGTICDLGCGYATLLSKICKKTGNPGLGFDSQRQVIAQTKKRLTNSNVTVERADISKLEGIWEDVIMLMQFHVLHDFDSEKQCIDLINSFLFNFPNAKCFFYMDTVSPSSSQNNILPGFDYIHGLLGIRTRTYEETLVLFEKSKYRLIKEVPFPDLPNTFLWILVPKKDKK